MCLRRSSLCCSTGRVLTSPHMENWSWREPSRSIGQKMRGHSSFLTVCCSSPNAVASILCTRRTSLWEKQHICIDMYDLALLFLCSNTLTLTVCLLQCSTLMLIESAKDSLSFSVTHYKHPKQPHTVQVRHLLSSPASAFIYLCPPVCRFPGKDSGGEEVVGSSHQTHHSGKPLRYHPTKGERALLAVWAASLVNTSPQLGQVWISLAANR